jgi:hypothetical protein
MGPEEPVPPLPSSAAQLSPCRTRPSTSVTRREDPAAVGEFGGGRRIGAGEWPPPNVPVLVDAAIGLGIVGVKLVAGH